MPCAFSGGPYYTTTFLPTSSAAFVDAMADNLTFAGWKIVEKVRAFAKATATTQPSDGTQVLVSNQTYTFKNSASATFDVQIGATLIGTITNLIVKVDSHSPAVTMSFDGVSTITAKYNLEGTAGNGTTMSGWVLWDPGLGAPTGALWNGGYKFRTQYKGPGSVFVPCIAYVYDANQFDWGALIYGNELGVSPTIQFMSNNQAISGIGHLMGVGSAATMRFIGSPVQFFVLRTDHTSRVSGSFTCGGSFFTSFDPARAPTDAWYSMGDWSGSPFGVADSLRLGTGFDDDNVGNLNSDCCYDGHYCGPGGSTPTRVIQLMETDNPAAGFPQLPITRYGGDPFVSEPVLMSGDVASDVSLRMRGQLFDSLIVGKTFPDAYTSQSLAAAYPWSNGATLSNGIRRNRLSADFDLANWINITAGYAYAGFFTIINSGSNKHGNYVY